MKKFITITIGAVGCIMLFAACNKADEVPPRDQGILREYIIPSAPFLSTEERAVLNEKRAEYQSIL